MNLYNETDAVRAPEDILDDANEHLPGDEDALELEAELSREAKLEDELLGLDFEDPKAEQMRGQLAEIQENIAGLMETLKEKLEPIEEERILDEDDPWLNDELAEHGIGHKD